MTMPAAADRQYATPVPPDRVLAPAAAIRRNRAFHLILTAMMLGIVVAGFWPYFRAIGRSPVDRPLAIHLHAVVFSGWMVLLAAQVVLVFVRDITLHRRIGLWGFAYGAGVIVMGIVATVVAPAAHVADGTWSLDQAASFLILPIGDMVLFGGLLWAAYAARRRPEAHKRYVVLATVALLFAPAARLMEPSLGGILAVWMAPVALAMLNDLWLQRRVHRAYWIGSAALLVAFTRLLVMESEAWLRIGRALVKASMPVVASFS